MQKKVIAIFGGSFNPPINSHIIIANKIINRCKYIDKFIFVPVSTKYNKENLIEDEHRYNMLNLICNQNDRFEVSGLELDSDRQLYTIETLDIFKEKYKNYEIQFVMGTDNLKELEQWRQADRILQNYKIIVIERGEDVVEKIIKKSNFLKKYSNSIIKLKNIEKIDLSSTLIREKVKSKQNLKKYIPKEVLDYIVKNNLYK